MRKDEAIMPIQLSISLGMEEDLRQLVNEIVNPRSPVTREDIEFGLAAFGVKKKDRSILTEKWCQDGQSPRPKGRGLLSDR